MQLLRTVKYHSGCISGIVQIGTTVWISSHDGKISEWDQEVKINL